MLGDRSWRSACRRGRIVRAARVLHSRWAVGTKTNTPELSSDLDRALPLLARDAVATAMAAGTLPGPEGLAMATRLGAIATDEICDLERVAARIASLGGSPTLSTKRLEIPKKWRGAVEWLLEMQRESIDALVAAIPADADDAEGEASEHLLEHIVARKRDVIEVLERALR